MKGSHKTFCGTTNEKGLDSQSLKSCWLEVVVLVAHTSHPLMHQDDKFDS